MLEQEQQPPLKKDHNNYAPLPHPSPSPPPSVTSSRSRGFDNQQGIHEFKRLHSRAEILRQQSATLLRQQTHPSLLRKESGLHWLPGADEPQIDKITLFYVTSWDSPCLHYTTTSKDNVWTSVPGEIMHPVSENVLNALQPLLKGKKVTDSVWYIDLPGLSDLEFVTTNKGKGWDKAPGNRNYRILTPGRYILRDGYVSEILEPPERPAVVRTMSVGSSSVKLTWNEPIVRVEQVVAYIIYRNGEEIASVEHLKIQHPATHYYSCLSRFHIDSSKSSYDDTNLMGLTSYTYIVYAVNRNGQKGRPSEEIEVTTGEPDKPGPVESLRVSDHSQKFIELSWQKPLDFGGAPIEVYRIYRNGIPLALKPFTKNDWESWTDTQVTPNTSYVYHVTACRLLPPPVGGGAIQRLTSLTKLPSLAAMNLARQGSAVKPSLPEVITVETIAKYLMPIVEENDYEGQIGQGIQAKAQARIKMARLHDRKTHILLQAFNWNSCHDNNGWFNTLAQRLDDIKESGVTMIWLPPPTASVAPQGYMPTRWYDLDTAYGSREELFDLLQGLRERELVPMLDFVANHRCGVKKDSQGQWTVFEDPPWEAWAIVKNNMVGYEGLGEIDTGAQSECAPDLDHKNERVRNDIKKWTKWLFSEVGFGALRIDMAPGYGPRYQIEYVEHLGTPFSVGEYWSGDVSALHNYIHACRGLIAAYDFALYYILRRSVESGDFGELSQNGKIPGLIGRDPLRAVTFIDNHDTCHLDFVGRFAGGKHDAVLRGIVYLLTHPGTPCLFVDHLLDPKLLNPISQLSKLRHEAKLPADCGVCIGAAEAGLYAAYISHDRYCPHGGGQLAMKLGYNDWSPQGSHWRVRVSGNQFCVWSSF